MIYCGSFVHVLRVNILRSFIISLKHVWRRREERFTVLSQNNTSDRVNGFLSVSGLCKCVFSSLCPTSFSNLVCVCVHKKTLKLYEGNCDPAFVRVLDSEWLCV